MAEICVATFRSSLEAELARSALESCGIGSRIESDNAGGAYPQLESDGVRLLVQSDDAQAAEQFLASAVEVDDADIGRLEQGIDPPEADRGRSPLLTLLLVSIAAFIGYLVGRSAPEPATAYDGIVETDQNGDGQIDQWTVYEANQLLEYRIDRNFDGRPDAFQFFDAGFITRAELDEDFDGKVDGWIKYKFGDVSSATFDLDGNGTTDYSIQYRFGVPSSGILHPNQGAVEREELFVGGAVREVYQISPGAERVLVRSFDDVGRERDISRQNARRPTSR